MTDESGTTNGTKNGTAATTTDTTYNYVWWSGAKASSVTDTGQTTGTSTYSYDANGYLYKLYDSGGTRTITYQNR